MLVREMQRSGRRWGRFDVAIGGRRRTLKLVAAMMNARSRLTGIATGDQGIFVERSLFAAIGGYPRQALMEDIELSKRLKRAGGPPLCLRERIVDIGSPLGKSRDVANDRRDVALALCLLAQCRPGPIGRGVPALATDGSDRAADLRQATGSGPREDAPRRGDRQTKRPPRSTRASSSARSLPPLRRAPRGSSTRSSCGARPTPTRPSSPRGASAIESRCARSRARTWARECGTALDSSLARGAHPILIGTDCPVLDLHYLARAVAALDASDAVFGPAEDGGYVLVGLARRIDAFTGIPLEHARHDGRDAREDRFARRDLGGVADALGRRRAARPRPLAGARRAARRRRLGGRSRWRRVCGRGAAASERGGQVVSQAIEGPCFSFAIATVAMSGSATPFFTAVTSARIDTAISGGVRLPM